MRPALPVLAVLLVIGVPASAQKKPKDDPAKIGNRDVSKGINLYSIDKEIAMGRMLAQEVRRQARMVDDPVVTEFVNRTGQNLVRNSDARVPFTFEVIEDKTPNAVAFPGGFVFVNTGLLELASEESELAGVLAHEIAHVAARHMTRQASRGKIADMLSMPLGGIGRSAAKFGMPMLMSRFDRAYESEADYLGVQYLYAAGYDPTGAVSILEKLESLRRTEPGAVEKLFFSHPLDSQRIEATQKEIQAILPERPEYLVTSSEYQRIRERVIRMDLERQQADAKRPALRTQSGADGRDEHE